MSKFSDTSLFKNSIFWIILGAFVFSLVFFFASPYLFDSFISITLRLLVVFSIFFGTIMGVMMYTLFMKEDLQKKLQEKKEIFSRKRAYSEVVQSKVNDLKTRFNEAMRIIKNSTIYKNSQSAGYELPWYLMVGKETEGKTSFLENSGLEFPLNINYDKANVQGEENSKTFKWYFAEDAIFIDMPGNYIEQKSSEDDSAVWEAFLKLFGKKRWKRPINGVVLTISVDTLMNKDDAELLQYGKDLRDRIDELSKAFMSSIPIYMLITKSDKIPGFNEYFATLSESEKDEVLGMTFDESQKNIDPTIVQPELDALLKRINSSVLDKINQEWDSDARAKILLFEDEFNTLFERINLFIDTSFAQTRYREPLMLRGIYFTSVFQSNSMPAVADSMQDAPNVRRGMFIQKLLRNIIFPEADIVKMDTNYKKSQRMRQIGAFAASIILVLVTTTYWVQDYNSRLDDIATIEKLVNAYDTSRHNIKNETDFENVLSTLDSIYALKLANEDNLENHFWKIAHYKVEDRNKILDSYYKEALTTILLPRIAHFIEDQITVNIKDYDVTWEGTKAYSMLNNEKRRENEFLQGWMAAGWSHLYPNKMNIQESLNKHFENLLAYGFTPYVLDDGTIELARNELLGLGHEALVYKQLKDIAKQQNLRNFRFSQALGSYASAFSGSDYEIPGFYTKRGFETVIVGQGRQLIKELISNNWVVGYSTKLSEAELNEMYAKVQNYYFIDYKRYWSSALSALKVPKYKSISEINNQLTVLTSGSSPIIGVLKALKENTMIYTPAEKLQMKAESTTLPGANSAAAIASKNAIDKAKKSLDNTSVKNVREYFSTYTALLNSKNKPGSKLESSMSKLNTVYQEMTAIYGSVTPEKDAFNIVSDRIAGRHAPIIMQISPLPVPVDKWFKRALKNDWEYLLSRTRKHINTQYKNQVLGFYNDKIRGRYPLSHKSKRNDIRLQDFEEFFKKGGILDGFYGQYVSPFVKLNTRKHNYSFRQIDGSTMNVGKGFLRAMLTTSDIRRTLFTGKEDYLSTSLYLKPRKLGRKLATMEWHYDDNYIVYEHGLVRSKKIAWPAESQNNLSKFSMYDLSLNKVVEIDAEGEWALFKLIDHFKVKKHTQRRGTDSVEIEFKEARYNGSYVLSGVASKIFTKENPLAHFKLFGSL